MDDVQNINQLLGASSGSNDPDVDSINSLVGELPQTQSQDPWGSFKQSATQISGEKNFPSNVLLGQAALESGRGTSNFAKNRNNYFGYEAYDSNPDAAKGYKTPQDSINDYIELIENTPRYAWAYQEYLKDHSSENLIHNIKLSGYATDPNYAEKVMSTPEFKEDYGRN